MSLEDLEQYFKANYEFCRKYLIHGDDVKQLINWNFGAFNFYVFCAGPDKAEGVDDLFSKYKKLFDELI